MPPINTLFKVYTFLNVQGFVQSVNEITPKMNETVIIRRFGIWATVDALDIRVAGMSWSVENLPNTGNDFGAFVFNELVLANPTEKILNAPHYTLIKNSRFLSVQGQGSWHAYSFAPAVPDNLARLYFNMTVGVPTPVNWTVGVFLEYENIAVDLLIP